MVIIFTNQPLKKVLHNPDTSGQLVAWAIELNQFTLKYDPRMTIKVQALVDLIIECSFFKLDPQVRSTEKVCLVTGVQLTQSC